MGSAHQCNPACPCPSPPLPATGTWHRAGGCLSGSLCERAWASPDPTPAPAVGPQGALSSPPRSALCPRCPSPCPAGSGAARPGGLLLFPSCRPGWRPPRLSCGGRSWSTAWIWRRPLAVWRLPRRGEARRGAVRAPGSTAFPPRGSGLLCTLGATDSSSQSSCEFSFPVGVSPGLHSRAGGWRSRGWVRGLEWLGSVGASGRSLLPWGESRPSGNSEALSLPGSARASHTTRHRRPGLRERLSSNPVIVAASRLYPSLPDPSLAPHPTSKGCSPWGTGLVPAFHMAASPRSAILPAMGQPGS